MPPPPQSPADDDDDTAAPPSDKEKAGQDRDLKQLDQACVSSADCDGAPQPAANLAAEAQLFTQLEAHHAAAQAAKTNALLSVKVSVESVQYLSDACELAKAEAEKILRKHGGDLQKALVACVTSFPHLDVYRGPDLMLG